MLSRGGGFHNRSKIGSAFENRGKLYPHEVALGPTFEWPIGSQHEYVYRANPYVGVPGNMIQGRFTTDEEWEAAAGYNNIDSAKVAMSDKPYTWPATGWPVKGPDGEPGGRFKPGQLLCLQRLHQQKRVLGIQVNQTGYAFGGKDIRDMVIYCFDIVNKSQKTYDSLVFGMYLDPDVGGSESAVDYANDRLAFDKSLQRVVYYDNGTSVQWGGQSGRFGFIMLHTPSVDGVERGITDLHYMRYDDDIDIDSIQYGVYSSSPSLYASRYGPTYFHPGANAPNIHYDDPATIGRRLTSCRASVPDRTARAWRHPPFRHGLYRRCRRRGNGCHYKERVGSLSCQLCHAKGTEHPDGYCCLRQRARDDRMGQCGGGFARSHHACGEFPGLQGVQE